MAASVNENWQFNKSVIERNRVMLEKQVAIDVTFMFPKASERGESSGARKPNAVIGAHKYMLISSSPVFWAMFCGDLKEGHKVTIDDVEYKAFMQMLMFIYCEEVKLSSELVMQILHASKKYMIPSLTAKCTQFLKTKLNADSACLILEQALFFEERELASECLEIIQAETQSVFASEGFRKIKQATLIMILGLDGLSIPEKDIFQASILWARSQMKHHQKTVSGAMVRKHLGQALYQIRFPTMSINELANVVSPTGIITGKEELQCFRYVSADTKPSSMVFPTRHRLLPIGTLIEYSNMPSIQKLTLGPDTRICHHVVSLNMLSQDVHITGIRVLCHENYKVGVHVHTSSDYERDESFDESFDEQPPGGVGIPCYCNNCGNCQELASVPMQKPHKIFTQGDMQFADIRLTAHIQMSQYNPLTIGVDYSKDVQAIEETDFARCSLQATPPQYMRNMPREVPTRVVSKQLGSYYMPGSPHFSSMEISTFQNTDGILQNNDIRLKVSNPTFMGLTLMGLFVQ